MGCGRKKWKKWRKNGEKEGKKTEKMEEMGEKEKKMEKKKEKMEKKWRKKWKKKGEKEKKWRKNGKKERKKKGPIRFRVVERASHEVVSEQDVKEKSRKLGLLEKTNRPKF